jgi:hypothetical protein
VSESGCERVSDRKREGESGRGRERDRGRARGGLVYVSHTDQSGILVYYVLVNKGINML